MTEGREQVGINYDIPADLHSRIKSAAEWKGQTLKVWITRALAEVVERQEAARAEQERKRRQR
jgi:hypothetical protein